jgi:hypothetical protein
VASYVTESLTMATRVSTRDRDTILVFASGCTVVGLDCNVFIHPMAFESASIRISHVGVNSTGVARAVGVRVAVCLSLT